MSKLKYYYDLMSQPSRALWIGLKMSKTPFEDCPVALRKKEQLTEEYKRINRFQKVPALVDGDFHLSESVAMIRLAAGILLNIFIGFKIIQAYCICLRYLAAKDLLDAKLYPKDLQNRARVDEFLEWQHLTLRYGCATYFWRCWLLPVNGLAQMPSQDSANEIVKEMEQHLKILEEVWLRDTQFVSGNKLTVADLIGASEIEQTKLCKYDVSSKFPKVTDWLSRVREEASPYYDEAHKYIYRKSSI